MAREHIHAGDGRRRIQKPQAFLEGDVAAEGADFSRDGRYVALRVGGDRSTARSTSGRIRVRAGEVTVSVGGGREPMWIENDEVFYRSLNGRSHVCGAGSTAPTLEASALQ